MTEPRDKRTTGADESAQADTQPTRRHFLVGALTSMPALAYLYGCDERIRAGEVEQLSAALAGADGDGLRWGDPAWQHLSPRERARRRRLRRALMRHVQAENDHDLDGIMRTMADDAEMVVNGLRFDTPDAIAGGHVEFGMSELMGGLLGTEVTVTQEYFTDDAILTRGAVRAEHVGSAAGFPGSGLLVELAYAAFYQFNRRGKLVSERITMDFGPLLAGAAAALGT